MRFSRIPSAVILAALAAVLAAAPEALAEPGHIPASAKASQAASPRAEKTVTKIRLVAGEARPGAASRRMADEPGETFSCDWDYGISSSTPVYNTKNQVVAYEVHYGISDECDMPMFLNATIYILDINTGKKLGETTSIQPFSENIDSDGSARLPVKNHFAVTYLLQQTVLPGFVWTWTSSPSCIGIGSINLQCTYGQPYST